MSRFGPFFALIGPNDPVDAEARWHSLTELMTAEVLAERVAHARATISLRGRVGGSPADTRAVVSTMSLGLFARILSPVIGAAITGDRSLAPDPSSTWFQVVEAGPVPLRTSVPLVSADPDAVLRELALPLAQALTREYRLSPTTLRGNLAAAVAGACHVIALVDPTLSGEAARLRARLLSNDPLTGAGTPTGAFVRRSCCLIYRLPMGYLCSNCVLVAHDTPMARRLGSAMSSTIRTDARRTDIDWTRPPFSSSRVSQTTSR